MQLPDPVRATNASALACSYTSHVGLGHDYDRTLHEGPPKLLETRDNALASVIAASRANPMRKVGGSALNTGDRPRGFETQM